MITDLDINLTNRTIHHTRFNSSVEGNNFEDSRFFPDKKNAYVSVQETEEENSGSF